MASAYNNAQTGLGLHRGVYRGNGIYSILTGDQRYLITKKTPLIETADFVNNE